MQSGARPQHPRQPGVAARVILAIVCFYRRWLSPLKGAPSCRFHPTCSSYAFQAVERYGALRGIGLAVRRISKCHPFHPGGFDPVPGTPCDPGETADPGDPDDIAPTQAVRTNAARTNAAQADAARTHTAQIDAAPTNAVPADTVSADAVPTPEDS